MDTIGVTERIKTFEDACNELTEKHVLVQLWRNCENLVTYQKDVVAYMKLRIITAALNEGWEPTFMEGELRWYSYLELCTQEEIDCMNEEAKASVIFRPDHKAYRVAGMNVNTNFGKAEAYAHYGCRLAFKTYELAKYAGEQFFDIYLDFLMDRNYMNNEFAK